MMEGSTSGASCMVLDVAPKRSKLSTSSSKFSQNLFLTYYRNALDSLTTDGYIETKDGGDTYYVVGLGDVCYTNLSWNELRSVRV